MNIKLLLLRALAVFICFMLFVPFIYIVLVYRDSFDVIKQELIFRPKLSTCIYDASGELIAELFNENRRYAALGDISPEIIKAFLIAEDRDFYRHSGYDFISMARALVTDLASGEIRQGGSTITQQLAKQLYTGQERTIRRKIQEIFIARELERQYDKDRILEMYLNQIYFGHGVYGVDSACRFFFRRDSGESGAVEAAVLAAIPAAPNRYSPLKNPRESMLRSRKIIDDVTGAGLLDREKALEEFSAFWHSYAGELAIRGSWESVNSTPYDRAPHFTDYMRRVLIKKYGEDRVYSGGLRVYTTLDLRQQDIAQRVVAEKIKTQRMTARLYNRGALHDMDRTLAGESARRRTTGKETVILASLYRELRLAGLDELELLTDLFNADGESGVLEGFSSRYESLVRESAVEGAFIALDVKSGGITAMVGGGDVYNGNQLNRSMQTYRQPGSAFKAFVYGAGIELKRISPATAFLDLPLVFREGGKIWSPSNYEKSFQGRVLARDALAASLNVASVMVYEKTGGDSIAHFASVIMGIPRERFAVDPTLALGTTEVSLMEMVRGFAAYARSGTDLPPHAIVNITDSRGRKIYERIPEKNRRVVSGETAYIMTSLLRDVVDRGTARGAIRGTSGFFLPAAGKTGTNTSYRDAWFIGYTPDLVAGVWFGCDSQLFSLGSGQGGAEVAAPVWGQFMSEVYSFRKKSSFPDRPEGVLALDICSKTGNLPGGDCPVRREVFIRGTEPVDVCRGDHSEITNLLKQAKQGKEILLNRERDKRDRRAVEKQGIEIEEHYF